MQLIGMLDSPYVRRVAVSLQLLGLRFEHQPLSVFRTFEQFSKINPVVKAPTLVCDDGQVLMDSTVILEYAEALARPRKTLMPGSTPDLLRTLRVVGLALAACEKSVQIYYERRLRPVEKQHEPWMERVQGQLRAAYAAIEAEILRTPLAATSAGIDQAGVSVAAAWQFTQRELPGIVSAQDHPRLAEHSTRAEALPEFLAAPYGPGTCRDGG